MAKCQIIANNTQKTTNEEKHLFANKKVSLMDLAAFCFEDVSNKRIWMK